MLPVTKKNYSILITYIPVIFLIINFFVNALLFLWYERNNLIGWTALRRQSIHVAASYIDFHAKITDSAAHMKKYRITSNLCSVER